MHLSRIQIKNFRNFKELDISLGENAVILGENKVGKTNLLFALRLILDPSLPDSMRCLRKEDFWDGLGRPLRAEDVIEISIEFSNFSENEGLLAVLADHLISPDPMVAKITYLGSSAESVGGSPSNLLGTGYGASSAQWYADRYNETGSPIYAVGGLLSSLWTPDTYLKTASALTIGYSISSWAASTGGPAAIPELNFGTQGNNYFRVIDKANQLGFRVDKPHLGHAADGFTNYIKSNYPHPHFWSW
jgi:hypothetical protein